MNILIVDDEKAQRQSLRRGLLSQEHQTIEAEDGEEALQVLNSQSSIDLVITDYSMPKMDGIALLEKIRRDNTDLPVIMMTAYGNKQIVVRALQNNCNGYIEKPFTLLQLMCEIQKVTSHQSQKRASYSDTINRMAHQINNPLMAIIGSAELSLEDEGGQVNREEQRSRLTNIIASAKRIRQINKHIMGLGRIMAEQPSPVNLLELLRQCLDMYADLLKKDKVAVTLETDGRSYVANVSRFGLEQVFKNLLLNAVEALQESTCKQIRIAFGRNLESREIDISIEDTGIGMEPVILSRIFNSYYTSKAHGTGIGLAVVKNVIEQFKGRIQVKSWPGEGTHFRVILPAR